MRRAQIPNNLPSSRFERMTLPVGDGREFGIESRFEMVSAPVRTDAPDFGMVGWRMMEASARLGEFRDLLPQTVAEWTGYPEVRAPLRSPQDIEVRLRDWQWNHLPSARRLTFIASEVVHHIRVCLDYCAYNAVWLAKGAPKTHTKFPLLTDANKWNKERRQGLPGVKRHHLEWIESVQPYNGVGWTAHLLDLSNQDKHRTAVELIPVYRAQFDPTELYSDPAGDPSYRGFQADNAQMEFRIVPAMEPNREGPPGESAVKVLSGLLEGGVSLVNKFLDEAGYSPMELLQDVTEDQGEP